MMQPLQEERGRLLGSLLLFIQTFFEIYEGRPFVIPESPGRESYIITICRELTKVINGETSNLLINMPPGYFKSTLCIYFVAWCMARHPESNFIYISYSLDLAAEHTSTIRGIMSLPAYRRIFGVSLSDDTNAKDKFKTMAGGAVQAFGSQGPATGHDAGLPFAEHFCGGLILDDMHNAVDIHSETLRQNPMKYYMGSYLYRRRDGNKTPIIALGQVLHEDDFSAFIKSGKDGLKWTHMVLPAIDIAGNPLNPRIHPLEDLLKMKEVDPYNFAAQMQQSAIPPEGGIFKPAWFPKLSMEPEIYSTFVTVDTAETSKSYNDATVFSFWGIYDIKMLNFQTNIKALHWLDCWEFRCEPKDLPSELIQFFFNCNQHPVKPYTVAIEAKSAGITLISTLKEIPGINILNIERTKASGSKTTRFLEMVKYVASKRITLPDNKAHSKICIDHMCKITANDMHRYDDICDTAYDAVKLALIDDYVPRGSIIDQQHAKIAQSLSSPIKNLVHARTRRNDVWQT